MVKLPLIIHRNTFMIGAATIREDCGVRVPIEPTRFRNDERAAEYRAIVEDC